VKCIAFDKVSHVYKSRNKSVTSLQDVSLEICEHEFAAVVGQSGTGKSTFLNLIAGIEKPSHGNLMMGGEALSKPGGDRVMMFEEPALLPWLTVFRNVAFGLELKGKRQTDYKKVRDAIRQVGLQDAADVYPSELSAGMAARVSLARALVVNPEILLLDECFANIDYLTGRHLSTFLYNWWETSGSTVVYVTHTFNEVLTHATKVIVIGGKPGVIKKIIPINLSFPRDLSSLECRAIKKDIVSVTGEIAYNYGENV
jgi:NitT/TauT family transport system ATP-binding protein